MSTSDRFRPARKLYIAEHGCSLRGTLADARVTAHGRSFTLAPRPVMATWLVLGRSGTARVGWPMTAHKFRSLCGLSPKGVAGDVPQPVERVS